MSAIASELDPPASAIVRAPTAAARAARWLQHGMTAWFGVAALGQLAFAGYVIALYAPPTVSGRYEAWNKVMPHGYIAGDVVLNLVLGVHLMFAAAIVLGGLLQMIPWVRRHRPALHRWNGRVYLVLAATLALGGLALGWGRPVADTSQALGISLNAVLILVFAAFAWRAARARRHDLHRRWALRLFLAVSGVWFFRVGLMAWIVANGGPVGFDPETFRGPFLTTLAFAQVLLPLAVLEGCLRAQRNGGAVARWTMSAVLALCTLVTLGGSIAAIALMWLPRL